MVPSIAEAPNAFACFREIFTALLSGPRWWGTDAWLRFAAQANVAVRGDPNQIATAIRSVAKTFESDAGWKDAIHSPLRFVVAAMLVQAGEDGATFATDLARTHPLCRKAGLIRGGIYEIVAIQLLRLGSIRPPIDTDRVERLHAIYFRLQQYDWWLSGPQNLPTCALLIDLPDSPEVIGQIVGEYHQRLGTDGVLPGRHLLLAAHILPLMRLPAQESVRRFAGLIRCFITHHSLPWQGNFEALGILSLLDKRPEDIVSQVFSAYAKLDDLRPHLSHQILITLAADLAFLDCIYHDRRLSDPKDPAAHQTFLRANRDAQAISASAACFASADTDSDWNRDSLRP